MIACVTMSFSKIKPPSLFFVVKCIYSNVRNSQAGIQLEICSVGRPTALTCL